MADLLRSFRKRANKAYFQNAIGKALGIKPLLEQTHFSIPNIDWEFAKETRDKQILYVTPFYGPDATSAYTDFILAEFRRRGYTVHAVVYNDSDRRPRSDQWDHVYHLKAQDGSFGRTRDNGRGADSDGIDDWAGDDLAIFVGALGAAVPMELCFCNFVYVSRALTVLWSKTYGAILTSDVFTDRNAKILATYGNTDSFFFSTSRDEERRGLERADALVAIQEEEEAYFSALCPDTDVIVMPMVPEVH